MSDSDSSGEIPGSSRENASISSGKRRATTDSEGFFETATARFEELRHRLNLVAKIIRGSSVVVRPYRPAEDGQLASFEIPDGEEEVDRYWVNAPFAYVVITYDDVESERYYNAVEPDLDAFEQQLLGRLKTDIRAPLMYQSPGNETTEEALVRELSRLLETYGIEVGMGTFYALFYYLKRDFRDFGKLDPLLNDNHIEDISCDGYELPIFVYHDDYTDIETNISFKEKELDNFVIRLAQQSGQHISVGDPMVEATLEDGSRAEMSLGREVTPRGSAFTIRQYADDPFTPIDLINYNTFSIEQMAYFWLCIENNKSLIFAGGTASGKTTSMNAVSMFIPPRSKVLTIEDTRELSLYHDNWLSSVTREQLSEGSDIDMYDLLRSALRHRPEYILVGEVRGKEAVTLFQAMNTGHTTFSTMHADSIETVINRLENEPINVPRAMVQSLDMLSIQTQARIDEQRVRRSRVIGEIRGIDQRTGELDYASAFNWDANDDTFKSNDSELLGEIQEERGWSRNQLLSEMRNRRRVLAYLQQKGISDYRQFTALINEYYADKGRVLDRIADDNSIDDPTIEQPVDS
ncbi:flagellar protein FlaI [Halohasta litchfieldiae]|jgi:flagellar protein FlaI|uniref:Flagellar protein FlaI n=1 Tax=Halohasta litchfieldiae TaxID=1073996 RepID=A0A1H6TB18_9EURY|nr:type II/IV secretion system ATPase subunit [Halohasta litchfieldiae]ATW87658.1 flagellar protein FlaI [Halohasta litchfieldiae]SEI76456.1 flagellar protein FlaI [Halohasta litchfieldiae]